MHGSLLPLVQGLPVRAGLSPAGPPPPRQGGAPGWKNDLAGAGAVWLACGARAGGPWGLPGAPGVQGRSALAAGGRELAGRRRRWCGRRSGSGLARWWLRAHGRGSGHGRALRGRVRETPARNFGDGLVVRADRGRDRRPARPEGPRLDPYEKKSAVEPVMLAGAGRCGCG